ncbi:MAG: hypothetical protein LBI86_10715 [Treponema sp.]|jgi:hypothetical protein|nr:hypothetical protein [Treponema sp.]
MKTYFAAFLIFLCPFLEAQKRSFDEIFPAASGDQRNLVYSDTGLLTASERAGGFSLLPLSGIDGNITSAVTNRNPLIIVETLMVIPDPRSTSGLIDVYNALGKIRNLKGRLYHSETRRADIPLFEDASRVDFRKNTALPDPPPASVIPRSETVYIRLKDANFGNCYYRGEISLSGTGLVYQLANYRNINYILFPIIKEEKFTAQLYLEPIDEGVLIYGISGVDVSGFIASKVDVSSTIGKRLAVIISWVRDGLSRIIQ